MKKDHKNDQLGHVRPQETSPRSSEAVSDPFEVLRAELSLQEAPSKGRMQFHPLAELFPLLEGKEFSDLVADITANGLREAIWTLDGQILDGRNRYQACLKAKVEPIFRAWKGTGSPLDFVISMNLMRRHLTYDQRVGLALKLRPGLEAEAKERVGGRPSKGSKPTPKTEGVSGESAQKAADKVDVGRTAVTEMLAVQDDPNLAEKLLSGKTTVKEVRQQQKHQKKEAVAKRIRVEPQVDPVARACSQEPAPLPEGPFRVIVVDPPWAHAARTEDNSHGASNPYPSMPTEDICSLPVRKLSHDDAVLWLWTTNALMRKAYDVAEAWGFEVKTILTWVKPSKKKGFGDWLRGQTEHCLLAVRGKPTVTLKKQTTALMADSVAWSAKPREFYALVEELCPGSKVELFARQPRDGWEVWGAAAERLATERAIARRMYAMEDAKRS